MREFFIDPEYLTDVIVTRYYKKYQDRDQLTHEELLDALRDSSEMTITGTRDHPEFAYLREQLGQEGYIQIQRSWSNGDRVLKPFRLNGVKFKKHEQFACAAAMKHHLEFEKQRQQKKGGDYASSIFS